MRVARRAEASLLEALSRMGDALSKKQFDQGAKMMRSVETMHPSDQRRLTAEFRAVALLDESSRLKKQATALRARARDIRIEGS